MYVLSRRWIELIIIDTVTDDGGFGTMVADVADYKRGDCAWWEMARENGSISTCR